MHRCTLVGLVFLNTGCQFAPVHAEGPCEKTATTFEQSTTIVRFDSRGVHC